MCWQSSLSLTWFSGQPRPHCYSVCCFPFKSLRSHHWHPQTEGLHSFQGVMLYVPQTTCFLWWVVSSSRCISPCKIGGPYSLSSLFPLFPSTSTKFFALGTGNPYPSPSVNHWSSSSLPLLANPCQYCKASIFSRVWCCTSPLNDLPWWQVVSSSRPSCDICVQLPFHLLQLLLVFMVYGYQACMWRFLCIPLD